MRKLALFVPLLAGIVAPAYAQDIGVSVRAEGRVGYDEIRADLTVQNSTFSDDFGFDGSMYGAEAGVDVHISRVLVGAYAGIDLSDAGDCKNEPFERRSAVRRDTVCLDAGSNLYAGGRLGISIGDGDGAIVQGGRLYVKGGLSSGKFSGSYAVTVAAAGQRVGPVFSGRDTVSGYHFGGGFELDVLRNFYIKGEYVQHRYKDAFKDQLNLVLTDPNPLRRTDRVEPRRHQFVFGAGIRFGGRDRVEALPPLPPPPPPPPPPPLPPPATQTCADGSVILATDMCPPPPPPPPPAPEPERG